MKIEKLAEDKLKITLTLDDLEARNIDLYSFMYNSPESQDLFWDVMSEAEKEYGFNKRSIVVDGCRVFGTVEGTVLSHGVTIGEGSVVKNSVIMSNAKIGKNVVIENAMIGEGAVIEDNCTISSEDGSISVVSEFEVVSMELV